MTTPQQYRALIDETWGVASALMHSYRVPSERPESAQEQRVLAAVQKMLQYAYSETHRLLQTFDEAHGGMRGAAASAAPSSNDVTSPAEPSDAEPATRRPRP